MKTIGNNGIFKTIEYQNKTYKFILPETESEIPTISNGQPFPKNAFFGSREKTRTSLRFDKFTLWSLELISRVYKNINRGDGHFNSSAKKLFTFNEIISDLIEDAYLTKETKELDKTREFDKQKVKDFLFRAFKNNHSFELVSLADLTYSDDYILRTLSLALFEKYLVSDGEKRLLKSIVTNKRFCNNPFRMKNDDETKERYLSEMLRFLPEIEIDFLNVFNFFGVNASELVIQKQIIYLEENPETAKNRGYLAYMEEAKWGWDEGASFKSELIKNEISEKEYDNILEKIKWNEFNSDNPDIDPRVRKIFFELKKQCQTLFNQSFEHWEWRDGSISGRYNSLIILSMMQGKIEQY
tara:strand:+ start:3030 stop:4094 length:1065 start_codon:yes stop_codon:yes gene_type:complete